MLLVSLFDYQRTAMTPFDPRTTLKNLTFSFIRTAVPALIVYLIGLVTENFGPIINEDTKAQLVALGYFAAFVIYYLIVRLLETYVTPHFSWLLGDLRKGLTAPVYAEPTVPVEIPPAVVVPDLPGE
jgi:hypothetical protein